MSIENRIKRLEDAMNPQGNPLLLTFMVIVYLAHDKSLITDVQYRALNAALSRLPNGQIAGEEKRQTIRRAVAAFLNTGHGGVLGLLQDLWGQCTEEPFPLATNYPEG